MIMTRFIFKKIKKGKNFILISALTLSADGENHQNHQEILKTNTQSPSILINTDDIIENNNSLKEANPNNVIIRTALGRTIQFSNAKNSLNSNNFSLKSESVNILIEKLGFMPNELKFSTLLKITSGGQQFLQSNESTEEKITKFKTSRKETEIA